MGDNVAMNSAKNHIPFTVGMASALYALYTLFAWNILVPTNNIAAILFFVACPFISTIALFGRTRFGWYTSMLLPVLYLAFAIAISWLSAHGVYYRWLYNDMHEPTFSQRDMAGFALFSAAVLIPAGLFLLTPTARKAIFPKPTIGT